MYIYSPPFSNKLSSKQPLPTMKREGRQHGVVRTYPILPSPWDPTPQQHRRHANSPGPPTAGIFTKVSAKPTNHSKFTAKCSRVRCSDCHAHPAGKAKDKAKGTLKRRTAHAVDASLTFSGLSATGILDHLAGDDDDYTDDDQYDYTSTETIGCDDNNKMSLASVRLQDMCAWEQEDEEDGWCLVVAE